MGFFKLINHHLIVWFWFSISWPIRIQALSTCEIQFRVSGIKRHYTYIILFVRVLHTNSVSLQAYPYQVLGVGTKEKRTRMLKHRKSLSASPSQTTSQKHRDSHGFLQRGFLKGIYKKKSSHTIQYVNHKQLILWKK